MAKVTQKLLQIPFGRCICTFYNNGQANVMMIDSFEVDEGQRAKGVGTGLLKKALELASENNVDSVELVVNQDNTPAIKLYTKVGFEKTKKDYYRFILNKKHG